MSYSDQEMAFVDLLNDYRAKNGVDPVLVSDILSEAATRHSHDMAKYGFFNHVTASSDWFAPGTTWHQRMVASGYPASAYMGENIGVGFDTAAEIFTAWKNSPSHNSNMLDPHWKVIGIGVESIGGAGPFWTTDFGDYQDATAHENGGSAPPDITAPVVQITSPTAGADVAGSVTVAITATDNLAVGRVDLYAQGTLVASDSERPYAIVWDTTALNPGTYVLEAWAADAAGNVGKTSRSVHVTSTPSTGTTTTSTTTTTNTTMATTTTTNVTTTTTHGTTSTTATTSSTSTTTKPATAFSDVPAASVFYQPVMNLAAAGVVSGYSDGRFYPENPVTRAQFAKMVVLALDKHTAQVDKAGDPTFNDVDYTGSEYPFDYVEEAVALGIIKGYSDGTFHPGANMTRVQLAVMLVRAGGDSLAAPPAGYALPFIDVPSASKQAVAKAYYNHLLSGKTTTKFDPYSPATRGQVAKMVYGLLEALKAGP